MQLCRPYIIENVYNNNYGGKIIVFDKKIKLTRIAEVIVVKLFKLFKYNIEKCDELKVR